MDAVSGKNVAVAAELSLASKMAVSSNPQGASVWVDGKDSGTTTPTQLTLEKGQHRITVRKAGYKEASTETNLAEGQTLSFSPVLLSLNQLAEDGHSGNILRRFLGSDTIPEGKGLVHIRTVPEGATIIIDGRVAPKKTNAKWPAAPGVYSIDLQMNGYKSIHRNIQVQQGKIKNLDEFFEKQ